MLKKSLSVVALAAGLCLPLAAEAAESTVKVGVLTCSVKGGAAYVIGSTKDLRCIFTQDNGRKERYVGRIEKFGIDVGVTGQATLAWTVLAPTEKVGRGALSGTYAGVAADASVGVGGGANVLVGGSSKTISLQPVSLQAQTGLNAALTVASLQLKRAN